VVEPIPHRPPRLVVGLGNPGAEYAATRHNAGYRVLDGLARRQELLFVAPRSLAELEGYRGPRTFRCARSFDPDALYVKPETYMNESGRVVAPLVRWAQLPSESLLVVYDDIDLPLGALRIRPHGGAGGQKGMRSIIDSLETERFPRLRVGIGRSTTDAARHVLTAFTPEEEVEIEISVAEATEAILDWLRTGDIEGCMTRFHSRWTRGDSTGRPGEART